MPSGVRGNEPNTKLNRNTLSPLGEMFAIGVPIAMLRAETADCCACRGTVTVRTGARAVWHRARLLRVPSR